MCTVSTPTTGTKKKPNPLQNLIEPMGDTEMRARLAERRKLNPFAATSEAAASGGKTPAMQALEDDYYRRHPEEKK